MIEKTRTKNAYLNIFFGFIAQIGIIILSFVGRKIFLHYLSADYLGINGLFSNILTVLSLGELGLDMAASFSLYKPVAEKNVPLLRSLVAFFRKIYFILSAVILVIGLSLIPFLKSLVTSDLPLNELAYYYILFLMNSVVSYFVAHKIVLLSACQEQRIQKAITLGSNLVLQIIHIVVLSIWKNFYVFIASTLVSTIISNIIISIICSKIHREIFIRGETVVFDKKPIMRKIFSAFLYKLGSVLVSSTDNILISIIVGTIAVGYYSNYYYVVTAIQSFITVITLSMISGMGNLSVKATKQAQSSLFDMLLLFYHLIAAIGLIGFSSLFNHLIVLWLGEQYIFNSNTVFIIAVVFYLTNSFAPVWMIREANGAFEKVKYVLLIRAALNLLLSILFGIAFGVFGILLATVVSLLLTNFWIEPKIVFKDILQKEEWGYWKAQIKYFLITVVSFILCSTIISKFDVSNSFLMLIVKAIIIIGITSICFYIPSRRTPEYFKLKTYFVGFFKKKHTKTSNIE